MKGALERMNWAYLGPLLGLAVALVLGGIALAADPAPAGRTSTQRA